MSELDKKCHFCQLAKERIWIETQTSIGFLDAYPVSEGHALVIPKRHVMILHDLTPTELNDIWALVGQIRKELLQKFKPTGFNIGVNEGLSSGQTIAHAHVHIIPRRDGDVVDPRGGIRWVIPEKAKYW